MPELPEAETIARTLGPHVEGRIIRDARYLSARVCPEPAPELAGRIVRRVGRYGKQVFFELDRGFVVIQLRMTGLLRWREEAGPYTRARFAFDHGACCFDDIRQFGSVRYREDPPGGLGPDPLTVRPEEFSRLVRSRWRMLKPLLLDQQAVRGLGNIYVDEILWTAGLHPMRRAADLHDEQARGLLRSARKVLREAIRCGGSSISDYVDADGRPGRFQLRHRVYGRAGESCARCGTGIKRIVVGQRGTHFCPRCQRLG